MNIKMNKIMALSMVMAVSMSSVAYAAADTTTSTPTTTNITVAPTDKKIETVIEVTNPMVLTYEKSLEMLYVKNNEILSLQKQILLQDDVIKEVALEAARYKGSVSDDEDKTLDRAKKVYVEPINARNTKKELIRNLADKKIELREKLAKYYINWNGYNSELALSNEVLKIQKKDYDTKALQYKLGKIASKDLAAVNLNYSLAKKDVDKIKRKIDLLRLDYNVLISNSYKLAFLMDDTSIDNALKVPNLEFSTDVFNKIVAANIEKDSALAKIDEQVEIIEEQKRIDHLYSSSGTDFVKYNEDLEKNKEDHANRLLAVEYQAYSDLYTMRTLQSDIESTDETLKFLNLKYSISEAQFKSGYITDLELVKAKKDIQEAKYKKFIAAYELYNAYTNFVKNIKG